MDEVVEKSIGEMSISERWAVFFQYLTDKKKRDKINEILEQEEGIAMAGQVLMTISRDKNERDRLLNEYKSAVDMQSKIVSAKREERQEILKLADQVSSLEDLEKFKQQLRKA